MLPLKWRSGVGEELRFGGEMLLLRMLLKRVEVGGEVGVWVEKALARGAINNLSRRKW